MKFDLAKAKVAYKFETEVSPSMLGENKKAECLEKLHAAQNMFQLKQALVSFFGTLETALSFCLSAIVE